MQLSVTGAGKDLTAVFSLSNLKWNAKSIELTPETGWKIQEGQSRPDFKTTDKMKCRLVMFFTVWMLVSGGGTLEAQTNRKIKALQTQKKEIQKGLTRSRKELKRQRRP